MARFYLILGLIFCLGCWQTEPATHPPRITIGMRQSPDSLNPYVSTRLEGEIISRRLFPQLFLELPPQTTGLPRLEPVLAFAYEWEKQNTLLKLRLKQGLVWSDGVPVTSEDVAFTLAIQKDPDLAWVSSDRKALIQHWQIVDALQIHIQFERASAFNLLDLNEGPILPKHHFDQWPTVTWIDRQWNEDMVVFGPYSVTKWAPDEHLVLTSIKPDTKPTLGFVFVRDKESLFRLVENGELDYAWGLPVARIPDLAKLAQPVIYPDLTFAFIGWNPLEPGAYSQAEPADMAALQKLLAEKPHPIFADVRVRQAMTLAIRRHAHLQKFWQGKGALPVNPWQAGLPYRRPIAKVQPYNAEVADRLLREAGWLLENGTRRRDGIPLRFTVICNTGSPIREAYLLAIQADLRSLGIEMDISMMEGGLYIKACSERNFDAMFGIFRTGTRPDLGSLYSDEAALGGFNFSSWVGQSSRLEAVQLAKDFGALDKALGELELAFQKDQPITMLYRGMNIGASSNAKLKVRANALDYLFDVDHW